MGQMSSVNRLPKALRDKMIDMLEDPAWTQVAIADAINAEAGKTIVSSSSVNRFVKNIERYAGKKRGEKPPCAEGSLARIAVALERIANSLEKRYKNPD